MTERHVNYDALRLSDGLSMEHNVPVSCADQKCKGNEARRKIITVRACNKRK